ncbi:MAG: helix-turn-helix transcriptional regulator [Solirubrobacteraceae bacterium]
MSAQVLQFRYPAGREPWVTKRDLAAYLGRSTRWVELMVRRGMPSQMIGGRRGFRLSAVEAWIAREFG